MTDYSQPDFYRFNEDSLKLVKFVCSEIKDANSILDLGAGSGIIGIELANKLLPEKLTLLELQEEWGEHLAYNLRTFLDPRVKSEVAFSSFGKWDSSEKFELIVANPPYYLPGHGQESQDKRKHLARTFAVDSWEILLKLIAQNLNHKGNAFIVVKNDPRILKSIYPGPLRLHTTLNNDLAFLRLSF